MSRPESSQQRRHGDRQTASVFAGLAVLGMVALSQTLAAGGGLSTQVDISPLSQVVTYEPPGLTGSPSDTVLLLHGKQEPTTSDPTWMAWLRAQKPFDRYRLLVPALATAEWNQPESIARLRTLLTPTGEGASVGAGPASRQWMVGFSAGASRGYSVAADLNDRLAGFAAFGGAVPASMTPAQITALKAMPLLIVCMGKDTVVPCERVEASLEPLRKAGATRITFKTLPNLKHELDLATIAPLLDAWMKQVNSPKGP